MSDGTSVGAIKAHLVADDSEWAKGMDRAARAMERFERQQAKAMRQLRKEQAAAAAEAKRSAAEISQAYTSMAGSLQGLATTSLGMVSSVLAVSSETEQYRNTLVALTGDADKAEQQLQKLKDFSQTTPFDLSGVTKAGVQLQTFGADVDRFLPLAGDLASVFGREVPDAALALGKALSGSQDGLQMLQDSWGITKKDLEAAGANMKSTGGIALETGADIEALAGAIEKVAQAKGFSGAMAQQMDTFQGKVSNLQDSIYNLKGAIGDALAPTAKQLAGTLTDGVNAINSLSAGQKAAIGTGVGLVAMMATTATGILGLVAGWKSAQIALQALNISMRATPFGAVVTAIGLAATAMAAYTASINAATAAIDKQIAAEEKRKGVTRGLKESGKVGADGKVRDTKGVTSAQLEALVGQRQAEFDLATQAGDPKVIRAASLRLGDAKRALAAKRAEEAAAKRAAGDKEDPKAVAKAEKAAERERAGALRREVAGVMMGVTDRSLDPARAIEQLKKIRDTQAKTADERSAIEAKIASLTGRLEAQKAQATKRAESERTAAAKKAAHEREAAERKAEAERKRAAAKHRREELAAEKAALRMRKDESLQAMVEAVKEEAAAVSQARASQASQGASLPVFSGGPIQGTIEERQALTAASAAAKRDAGIASNLAERARVLGARAKGRMAAMGRLDATITAASTRASVASGTASAKVGAASSLGREVGEQVASSLQEAPITINVIMGGSKVATFSGPASDLARASNVVNNTVPLGKA